MAALDNRRRPVDRPDGSEAVKQRCVQAPLNAIVQPVAQRSPRGHA